MAAIVILNGPQQGQFYPLGMRKSTNIGRMPSCDMQLADEAVSRKHLHVRGSGVEGEFYVSALGDAKIIVNEVQVSDEQALVDGDIIRIGLTQLKFVSADPEDGANAMYLYKDPAQRSIRTIDDR